MIDRVAIAGVDLDLLDVFGSVTIRHGRGTVDSSPQGSTATLSLVNVTQAFVADFLVGAVLEIDVAVGVPRFRGRITDAALDAADATLALIAASTLSRIGAREVGVGAWPSEAWSDRVERVFTEAGELANLVLELGDDDPTLAARAAGASTLGAELTALAETVPAAIADLPDGTVLVQAITARKAMPVVSLDPLDVALAPQWAQVDDVSNVVRVDWDGGTVEVQDAVSIAANDERAPLTLSTELAFLADANTRALLELTRRSRPDWVVDRADLLELDLDLVIGSPVVIPDQPAAAPRPVIIGLLEGWTDQVVARDGDLHWTQQLALSPARLSGYGVTWGNVNPAIAWEDVDPSITWADNEELLYA